MTSPLGGSAPVRGRLGAMRTIDISMTIRGDGRVPRRPPDPGRKHRSIDHGDPYGLSVLSMGSHAGTHIDPPSHFLPGGASVTARPRGIERPLPGDRDSRYRR